MGGQRLSGPLIDAAGAADAAAVVALWQACGLTRPWNDPHTDFDRALMAGNATILLARIDAAIIGSAMVGQDGHRGWVYYLAVVPERRGQGIGGMLMAAAEAWLIAAGIPKVQLMVRGGNDAALGFYRKLGLERQDVVVLGRFLTATDSHLQKR
ncbi:MULTISPECIES: GNAT family acetyltransferase [unclassified Sphingomonas]|uniref:GNAT family acetyltransferase n=1 Tax=unclassified Sphingomonas TaxID=196159 RepID=UPI0012E2989D|nr:MULTISPECIES: GNAT family acetyltransferase [unclassified Sphingomonas]